MTWGLQARHDLLAGRVTMRELAAGEPHWLCPPLAATKAARERLTRWAVRGGLDGPEPSWTDIRDRLAYLGDESVLRVVVHVLAQIASPARDHMLRNVQVLGVGRETNGWTALAPPRPADADEPLRLIAVSGATVDNDQLAAVVAHECAHAWLKSSPPEAAACPAAERRASNERLLALAAAWQQPVTPILKSYETDERQAATLAAAWGFTGAAADAAACITATRQHLRAAVAAAADMAPLRRHRS